MVPVALCVVPLLYTDVDWPLTPQTLPLGAPHTIQWPCVRGEQQACHSHVSECVPTVRGIVRPTQKLFLCLYFVPTSLQMKGETL
jgi:hypothetical protein